ncbi:hypothetical protein [Paenibacillus sp. IHB B 3084]|uniref:hypothetical protein n=1 Tax=Paenibacillus sp. IHB B 3084 TaxID=867076 RepID=UPI0016710143|nr:hypothetical protein [Paenibacillus sp. IHB B 3084]
MAQALIQQRFYVGAYRRFYERSLRINFATLYAAYGCTMARRKTYRQTIRPVAVARHVMPPSLQASPVVRISTHAHLYVGSRLRSLSLARSWEGCRQFATQIRQLSQERCFATEKQWNTLFYHSLGCAASYVPYRPLFLLPHEGWCWIAAERTESF